MATVNTNLRVDKVSQHEVQAPQLEEQRRRLNLDSGDRLDRGRQLARFDFSTFHGPMSPEDQAGVAGLFSSFKGDQAALRNASLELGTQLMSPGAISTNPTTGAVSMSSGLQGASSSAMTMYLTGSGADAQNSATQGFMYMALGGMEAQLGGFAETVKFNTQIVKEMRTEITELQEELTNWPNPDEERHFTWIEVTYDAAGTPTVTEKSGNLNKAEAEALKGKLDSQMSNANDIGALKQFELQKLYQDYTQGVSTLAAIIKSTHDDLMKIVNNMKA